MRDRLVKIKLERPLTFTDMRELSYLFAADPAMLVTKHDKTEQALKAKMGSRYLPPEQRNRLEFCGFLAETTKMGAYSFNLPAGPTAANSLGTCPVSAVGWPIDRYRKKVKVNALADAKTRSGKVDIDNWICGSCYAMKGAYGSPGNIMRQELRRRVVVALLSDPANLARWFVRAIRWGQVKSILDRETLAGKLDKRGEDRSISIPDPKFFRIHDAGDFGLGRGYVQAWYVAVRACAAPIVVKVPKVKAHVDNLPPDAIDSGGDGTRQIELPAVRFWAATRAWCVESGLESEPVPDNLVLRPSALSFGNKSPSIQGYAPGTTAAFLDESEGLGDWLCPAYTPTDPAHPRSAPGACHKSAGPSPDTDPNDRPSPEGYGCRTCWNKDRWRVVYVRH